jgi:hypothetical protein
MAKRYTNITTWLNSEKSGDWPRQRGTIYGEQHNVGEGYFNFVKARGADKASAADERGFIRKHVPGFNRETSVSSFRPEAFANNEWPIVFTPHENRLNTPLSWRSRLGRDIKATPMISEVKANPRKGMMLVTFSSNGAVVQYDHVPREVIAELRQVAANNGSLGRHFWEIVRYRGQAGGSKYPFYYSQKGAGASEGTYQDKQLSLERNVQREIQNWSDPEHQKMMIRTEGAGVVDKYYTQLKAAYANKDYDKMSSIYKKGLSEGFYENLEEK